MKFRIKANGPFSRRLKRMARARIAAIRDHLDLGAQRDAFQSIHDARRDIKKYRALLRLIRERLGEDIYQRENGILRDVAHSLSPFRDAAVQESTLQKLHEIFPQHSSHWKLSPLKNGRLKKQRPRPDVLAGSRAAWEEKFQSIREEIDGWPVKPFGKDDFRAGLKKARQRYPRAYQKARKAPTTRNLHAWRQRSKNLSHQLGMLKPICSRTVKALAKKLNNLNRLLGDDHDLAILEKILEPDAPAIFIKLQPLIHVRRREQQQAALKLGRQVHRAMPARMKSWISA